MYFMVIESDQLYTWSDDNPKPVRCRIAKTAQLSAAPVAPAASDPPRFPHRTLQTMRQAGVQMRRRPRPWPQVLSVGQLSGLAAANGLRAPGALRSNGRVPRQLPPSPRDSRGDLRDQPRATASPRGALKAFRAQSGFCPPCTDRCGIGRPTPRQYARSLARRQPTGFTHWEDNR
jgi:hypothetical protein